MYYTQETADVYTDFQEYLHGFVEFFVRRRNFLLEHKNAKTLFLKEKLKVLTYR